MTGQEIKNTTVYPIAGVDFHIVPRGVAVTIRYYVQEGGNAATEASQALRSLSVGLTEAQATDVASSLQRAAQIIQSRPGPEK
jgi:hypothetical protein